MANLLTSSLISVAATVASLAAGFTSNIIAGRLLGPDGSGTVAFAVWVATSASAMADLGLPQALLRNGGAASGHGEEWKGFVHAAFRTFLVSVSVVGTALLLYAAFLGHSDRNAAWIWVLTMAVFASYAFAAFSTAVARSRGLFGQTATSTVIGGMLQVPLVFVGAWFWGAAGALIGYVARFLPQALRIDGHRRQPVRRLTPEMRTYSKNMWLSDLIDIMVLSRIEFLFLGIFFAPAQIGYFAAGLALAGLIEQVTLQISPALIVGFSDAHARGDAKGLETAYHQVVRVVALIMLPVSFGGAAIMPQLLPLVFGPLFLPAVPAAVILMAFVWSAALAVIPWGLIGAAGHSNQILRIQIASGFLTLLLLLLIVPWGGLEGAAWSRGGLGILTLVLLVWVARTQVGPSLPWAALAKTSFAAALCAGAATVPIRLLDGLPAVMAAIIAGAITYAFSVRIFRLVGADEAQSVLDGIATKIPRQIKPLTAGLASFIAPR